MDEVLAQYVTDLRAAFERVLEAFPPPVVADDLAAEFAGLKTHLDVCARVLGSQGLEAGAKVGLVKDAAERALALAEKLKPNELVSLAAGQDVARLRDRAYHIITDINTSGRFSTPTHEMDDGVRPSSIARLSGIQRQAVEAIKSELRQETTAATQELRNVDRRLTELAEVAAEMQSQVEAAVASAKKLYVDAEAHTKQSADALDRMLGHQSSRFIAGDFEQSAGAEAVEADRFRYGAIGCLALVVLLVCVTFFQSVNADFDWHIGIARLLMGFVLVLPAAYLARESAKHRQQQYAYLQTALSLKTMTPYMAPLPEEQQHALRVELAHRIFAMSPGAVEKGEVALPSSQEIIIELIRKLERPAAK